MLRSILIRQTFMWIDLALAALFVVTAAVVILSLLRPATLEISDAAAKLQLESAAVAQLPGVAPKDAYAALVGSGLFGKAGREAAPEPEPEPAPEPELPVVETQLNLHLIGTTATQETRFASAIIEETGRPGTAAMYVVGEQIMDKVTLVEVGSREVYILNETNGDKRRERLSMDEGGDVMANLPANIPQAQPVTEAPTGGVQRITLNKAELMQDIMTAYPEIATKVRPELARDESGNVIGVTANNISTIPLARKLGLGDGDVLQTVNNEQIDSEQKIYEMINKYQNASSLRIGVLSGGKPKVITYRLN